MEAMTKEDQVITSSRQDEMPAWKRQLMQGTLRGLVFAGFLAAAFGSYTDYADGMYFTIPVYWLAWLVVVVLAFWRSASYRLQSLGVMTTLYLLALLQFVTDGRSAAGQVLLLGVPFAAALFLGRRQSFWATGVATLTIVGFAVAYSTGQLTLEVVPGHTAFTSWLGNIFVFLLLASFMILSHNFVIPYLTSALEQSRRLTDQLAAQQASLEERVIDRTADVERRNAQLETAAGLARDAAAIQDLEELLVHTAQLITERFGFYHAGIFLLDESGDYAALRAASSEGGQRMLAQGHRLRVGQVGLVGYVTQYGQPRIALDVGADAVFFDNPDLPYTRSEMALPLSARGRVIGALDVQSRDAGAFGEQDIEILQIMADQIALAISNAQLFRQVQESLEAERRAFGELSRQAWLEQIRGRRELGGRHDPRGALGIDHRPSHGLRKALTDGETVVAQDGPMAVAAVPIQVRGNVIGTINAYKPEGTTWTDEEIGLLETLTGQLDLALESARLYQETRQRAAHERIVAEVTSQMRQSLDLESVVKTAAVQIRQALALDDLVIQLAPAETESVTP